MKQFDKNADAYQTIRHKIAYPETLYRKLAEASPARQAALDIGCGNGVSTIRLKPHFEYVEGQDLGAQLIEKARQTYPEVAFKVSTGEELTSDRPFDLVTSATSFYWMDRDAVLKRVARVLTDRGIFCAYKYDFPIVYGPIRDVVERELAHRWAAHRDPRLTRYDDTLEIIQASGLFQEAQRFVLPNIIELTPREVALFFLSASYVTRTIEAEGLDNYAEDFISRVCAADSSETVKVNFDIHGFQAMKSGTFRR